MSTESRMKRLKALHKLAISHWKKLDPTHVVPALSPWVVTAVFFDCVPESFYVRTGGACQTVEAMNDAEFDLALAKCRAKYGEEA